MSGHHALIPRQRCPSLIVVSMNAFPSGLALRLQLWLCPWSLIRSCVGWTCDVVAGDRLVVGVAALVLLDAFVLGAGLPLVDDEALVGLALGHSVLLFVLAEGCLLLFLDALL